MDSVVLVPDPALPDPTVLLVLRSRNAQPKKLGLPGALMLSGLAGATSAGPGGAGWATTCADDGVGSAEFSVNAATARLRAPSEARAARVSGMTSAVTPRMAAIQVTRTIRGRTGEALQDR